METEATMEVGTTPDIASFLGCLYIILLRISNTSQHPSLNNESDGLKQALI